MKYSDFYETEQNKMLSFRELFLYVQDDASNKSIYKKSIHIAQYLSFQSHHPEVHKRSVAKTLTNRAKRYVTTAENKKENLLMSALKINNCTEWAHQVPPVTEECLQKDTHDITPGNQRPMLGNHVTGLSEQLNMIYKAQGAYVSRAY